MCRRNVDSISPLKAPRGTLAPRDKAAPITQPSVCLSAASNGAAAFSERPYWRGRAPRLKRQLYDTAARPSL